MKRILALFLVFMMAVTLLAACGKVEPATPPSTAPQESDKPAATPEATPAATPEATPAPTEDLKGKKITIGSWGGNDAENASITKMIADFTAKTGIQVENKVYTDYNTQLKADLIAGTAPDAFYVDAYMAPFFINQGVLAEIDQTAVQADKFYPSLVNAFTKDGKLYAVSKDFSTLALYYNKKWVSEADLPKTTEELYSAAFLDKIQAKLPQGTIALTYDQDLARLLFRMQIDGTDVVKDGKFSNLADPKIAANIKPIFDMAVAKKIMTASDLGQGWNGEAFGNEKTAMMVEGNWTLGYLKSSFPNVSFGIAELPPYQGKKGTMTFTVGWGLNVASKEPKAALEYIRYATGTEGMATWCGGAGVLPSRSDVAAALGVEKDPLLIPHIAGGAYATPWQKGETMDIINREFINYFSAAVKGEMTLADMMKKAEDEANKQIQ